MKGSSSCSQRKRKALDAQIAALQLDLETEEQESQQLIAQEQLKDRQVGTGPGRDGQKSIRRQRSGATLERARDGSAAAEVGRVKPVTVYGETPGKTRAPKIARTPKIATPPEPVAPHYGLRLFVTGTTPRSARAIQNIRTICEAYLPGCYDLEVIDIYQHPEHVKAEQIVVTPTLVRHLPQPVRKLIGDLSDTARVLAGLDIPSPPISASPPWTEHVA